jgi:hypothetical protein
MDGKSIIILEYNPPTCRICNYPSEDDQERVLVRIDSDNSESIYAIKCPNLITPEGKGCINTKFLGRKPSMRGKGEIAATLPKEKLRSLYYEQKKSLQDIAREFNCTRQTVLFLMEKYGMERRSQSKARLLAIKEGKFEGYTHDDINEDFFNEWSPEMAWVLGLLFTDGNANGGRISITSIDFDLLEKVQKLLNSTRSIQKCQQPYDKTKRWTPKFGQSYKV